MVVGILCGWFGVWVVAGGLRALRSVFGLLLLLCLVAVSVVLWVWAILWICGLGCWLVALLGCWVGAMHCCGGRFAAGVCGLGGV